MRKMINCKKLLAVALSVSMIMGSGAVALAADQEGMATGTGTVEYMKQTDVFSVVLPTSAGTTFDYILDPDGLIAATSGSKYTDKKFAKDDTVYFLHAEKVDGTEIGAESAGTANLDYTSTSDEIKVVNKSTQNVTLKVNAKIAEATGITMATSDGLSGEGENLYIALIGRGSDDTTDTTKPLTTSGVNLDVTINADPNAYETTYDSQANEYKRTLTAAAQASDYNGFKSYTFKLTGKAKANDAALLALKENPPKIDLIWSVADFTEVGKPSIATRNYTLTANTAIDIPVTLGENDRKATKVVSVKWAFNDFEMLEAGEGFGATYDASTAGSEKVTLNAATVDAFLADSGSLPATLKIEFDDPSNTVVSITLNK